MLAAGSVLNYIDRAALGVVMPQIRSDLGLTNAGYGLAVNGFLISYMVIYVLGGRLADRLGCRRTFSIGVVAWSIAQMLHAAAGGLRSLFVCRALLGIGEGGFYPCAIRGAAEWFPPETRAKVVGQVLGGLTIGTLVTPPLVAWITIQWGWRAAFVATGAFGFVLLVPWLAFHRHVARAFGTPDPAPALSLVEHIEELDVPLVEVLRRRKYWCVATARAVTDAAWYFYLFWMSGYFQDARGFSLEMVGRWLWIPYLAAYAGAVSGAWASSALIQRGASIDRGRRSVLIPSALLAALGGFTYLAPGSGLAVATISLALFGHLSWATNIHTVISEITPRRHLAVLYGITGAYGTLLGVLTQPVIGGLVDHLGYGPAYLAGGLAYVLAIILLLAAGRIEPIRRPIR